ncbi:DNA polymerase III epsilon subunit [Corynebacterium deserti GIMN1.010]|uniref:DNA polymerase III epsilon subunit n=1 Tax=Corynebacterium deserti GIMN1.010 TaxID=931089 RepID=A0A0M4CLH8_9CORY|nr:exonuclease domain-containing protein [Corynebacterium deserti]ALC05672.1 DNA polymerase III epsilon subunit [Corynebacterium deserti GIMN1.010]
MFGRRKAHVRRARGALKDFYGVPGPEASTSLKDLKLLAVDVETTGLKPREHQIVSMGWVPINGDVIDFSGAGYVVIRGSEGFSVGSSAVIHQLTDDEIAAGIDMEDALTQLLTALQGRAMLAHFSAIERDFISAQCVTHFGAQLEVPIVDTFTLERRHMERMSTYPRGEDLRLPRIRQRYGLPHYSNHQALSDALACAEVYLVHLSQLRAQRLGDIWE